MPATLHTCDTAHGSPLDALKSLAAGAAMGEDENSAQLPAQLRWHRVGLRLQQDILALLTPAQQQHYVRDCKLALARTAANIQTLCRIANCLDACGIPYLSLKGPALAQLLYGSVFTKQSADIDILVRPADTLAAIDALASIGITSPDNIPQNPHTWKTLQLLGKDWVLDDASNGCHVELHWRVEINPFLLATRFDQWFARKSSVRIGGTDINTLGIEDLFIHVMVHGARSLWTRLHWLLDLDALLRRKDIDWQHVSKLIAKENLQQILLYSWALSHRLLATPLPHPLATLIEKMSPGQHRRTDKLVNQSLHAMQQRRHIVWLPLRLRHLQLKQTLRFQLFEFATMTGVHQPDVMKLPLPIYLLPVYFLLRPWFVIQRRLSEH